MKPLDVKSDSYCEYSNASNLKKIKIGDLVRILKCKDIFAKGYNPNWSKKTLLLAKLKIQFHRYMLLEMLRVKKLLELFIKRNCKRLIKKNLE